MREQFPVIRQNINPRYEQLLKGRQFQDPLALICQFEYKAAARERNPQWRLGLDFDDYMWSHKTVKPHFLIALVSLEIGNEVVHFKYQLCSSFNEALQTKELEKIEHQKLNDTDFVTDKIKELKQFLEQLPEKCLDEIKKNKL